MCAVPVECAAQVPDIMPAGRSIVNVMSWPDIVPDIVPRMLELDIPEKLIVPVTFEPVCVSCQFMEPIPAWPIIPPAPSVLVVESVAVPAQVPVTGSAEPGAVGAVELPPHAAVNKPNSATILEAFNIVTVHPF
jgi:hypothetical protein